MYENIERENQDGKINTVLVSAASLSTLKKAYPNYFVDVSAFVNKVKSLTVSK